MELLVPARLRYPATMLVLLCVVIVGGLGASFHQRSSPAGVDRFVADWVHRLAGHHAGLMEQVIRIGDPLPVAALVVGLALGSAALGRWRTVLFAVVGPTAAVLLTEFLLKPTVGRTRYGQLAFPSGHTTGTAAVVTVVLVLFLGSAWLTSTVVKAMLILLGLGVSVAVSVALVGRNWHYATDTLGGICVAVASVLVVALVIDELGGGSDGPPVRGGRGLSPATAVRPSRGLVPAERHDSGRHEIARAGRRDRWEPPRR
ncbi:phosphatase PAP2 family protein [Kutzneria sp. CA-103260]|uniref:phosphatase PAP2 family protein n=1 Tax=Kutzneria sp. CA-103260 TaxID=2802641 RepID=UPI001BAA79D5|nr:phosphatase PAP2 family protein [Kutzneria sp. CA-103260]QUQ68734.1 PAP2 superfamily protein [Kutzneria sp. CA-103260]